MSVGKQQIFVEVKDLDLNPEEKQASRALKEGGMPLWGSPPGARVRTKIDKARRQLKNCAESGQPALLVLFDTRSFPFNTTEPYDIKVAMYGFETYVLSVPLLGMGIPKFTEKIFGKDRKCSLETNAHSDDCGHPNRRKAATDSGRRRPPVPIDSGHLFRMKQASCQGQQVG